MPPILEGWPPQDISPRTTHGSKPQAPGRKPFLEPFRRSDLATLGSALTPLEPLQRSNLRTDSGNGSWTAVESGRGKTGPRAAAQPFTTAFGLQTQRQSRIPSQSRPWHAAQRGDMRVSALTAGSHAANAREPGQVRKEAALSDVVRAPWASLVRVGTRMWPRRSDAASEPASGARYAVPTPGTTGPRPGIRACVRRTPQGPQSMPRSPVRRARGPTPPRAPRVRATPPRTAHPPTALPLGTGARP